MQRPITAAWTTRVGRVELPLGEPRHDRADVELLVALVAGRVGLVGGADRAVALVDVHHVVGVGDDEELACLDLFHRDRRVLVGVHADRDAGADLGVDQPGADQPDVDEVGNLLAQQIGHRQHGVLAGDVLAAHRYGVEEAVLGADVVDRGRRSLLDEELAEHRYPVPDAHQVDAEDVHDLLRRDVDHRLHRRVDAGVVDDDVDLSELADREARQSLDGGAVRDIAGGSLGLDALLVQLRDRLGDAFHAARGDHEASALVAELLRECEADTGCSTGDDDDLVLEVSHALLPFGCCCWGAGRCLVCPGVMRSRGCCVLVPERSIVRIRIQVQ